MSSLPVQAIEALATHLNTAAVRSAYPLIGGIKVASFAKPQQVQRPCLKLLYLRTRYVLDGERLRRREYAFVDVHGSLEFVAPQWEVIQAKAVDTAEQIGHAIEINSRPAPISAAVLTEVAQEIPMPDEKLGVIVTLGLSITLLCSITEE